MVLIWDVNELVCVKTLSCNEFPVRGLSYSHDGQILASASQDPHISLVGSEQETLFC